MGIPEGIPHCKTLSPPSLKISNLCECYKIVIGSLWIESSTNVVFPDFPLPMLYTSLDTGNFYVIPQSLDIWAAKSYIISHSRDQLRKDSEFDEDELIVLVVGSYHPEQVSLERLFIVDDIRVGATSRKSIPALVDLLKPIPDRPGVPFLALGLLNQLETDCASNMQIMVEAGVLEALSKYLSLGPQDATEEAASELLGILFSSAEIRCHESAFGAVNLLVAVLSLGGRNSRYSAAKALENLFSAYHIRSGEPARQAIQPLWRF